MSAVPKRWLLLRGLAREKRHWGAFPDHFAKDVGVEVHTIDLPGMGTEVQSIVPTTVQGITDDLRARWLALGGEGPAGIFAVSLGGMILLDWCTRYPGDFARAVIVNSSAGNLSPFHHRLRPPVYRRLFGSVLENDPRVRERTIVGLVTNLQKDVDTVAGAWASYAEDTKPKRASVLRQLWAGSRFKAPVKIDVPLLVLGSKGDRFVDPRCSERIAERFSAPIEWHDDAGHDLPLDAPAWVTAAVRRWVMVQA